MKLRWPVALAFLAPALLLYMSFLVLPTVASFALSLTDFRGTGTAAWVGLSNYSRMLEDDTLHAALSNTVTFTLLVVFAQNGLGLLLAVWLGKLPRVRNTLRVALFTPSVLALVIVGYVWSYIFYPLGGPLNTVLDALGLGNLKQVWLGGGFVTIASTAGVMVWTYLGHSTAIYLAGYLSIPRELTESAELDGAGPWQRFWKIEWPLLAPATTVTVTLSLIGCLRVFDLPYALTGGIGGSMPYLSVTIYRNAFVSNAFGYAAAIAVVTVALIVLASGITTQALRARENRL